MTMSCLVRRSMIGFALVPSMALIAQRPVHYGFSAHVNIPMADLDQDLHGKVGAGGSFQISIETSDRTIMRPRIDLDFFPVSEEDRPNSTYRDRVDLGSVGLGADFLYSFSGTNDHGVYGLGGVGIQRWLQSRSSRDTDGHDYWHNDDTVSNRNTPWLAVGAGYQFNSVVGLEGRVVGSKYNAFRGNTSGSRTAMVTQVALTCRW